MKVIKCKCGLDILIDDDNYEGLNKYNWFCAPNGEVGATFFAETGRPVIHIAHFIIHVPDGLEPDHIDRNKHNNLRSNLRLATRSQNLANRSVQKNNTSGYKGVYWNSAAGKWQAQINVNKKHIYLGLHENIHDAACAYNQAATKHFGEFAYLNVIIEGVL